MATQTFNCPKCGAEVVYVSTTTSGGFEFRTPSRQPEKQKTGEIYLTCPNGHQNKYIVDYS